MQFENIKYKSDCKYFRGHIPCNPHKTKGYHCEDCPDYCQEQGKILIIKLGAIGDVIRTTPLLEKFRLEYPGYSIWWLTLTPEVVPSSVEKVLKFGPEALLVLQATEFDILVNLDKDDYACALTKMIKSDRKIGYTLINGKPAPIDSASRDKFITGLFDDVNQSNKKNYMEEIFEIMGWKFKGQEYVIEFDESAEWDIQSKGKKIIGLNTGCGARWTSRLWKDDYWVELIRKIQSEGFYPLLLGGPQEDDKNRYYAEQTGAEYLGYFPLPVFISLMNQCDVIVSAVTMGMHIAIALRKQLVLMNNIFNPNEFELYGRGEIVMPQKECTCFFSPKCKNNEYFCLDSLTPDMMMDAVKRRVDALG